MDNHQFYLVNIKNQDILKSIDTYTYILDIDRKNKINGFKHINIIDKIEIDYDFMSVLYEFLLFIPNDTPKEIQVKSNFGLNYYGITVLKNSNSIYNIFDGLYKIFEQFEDKFYIYTQENITLITNEIYNNLISDEKNKCEKLYKKDILYNFKKMKDFSLKLKENNFYIIHLGI